MAEEMSPFPVQKMMFYLAQDVDDSARDVVRELVEQLGSSRQWILGPPKFIDVIDQPENGSEDLPIETVGGYLEIYSALQPASLPKDIDFAHYSEVESLIGAISKISHEKELAFELELNGTLVGSIVGGKIDRILQVGLLDPWREHVTK